MGLVALSYDKGHMRAKVFIQYFVEKWPFGLLSCPTHISIPYILKNTCKVFTSFLLNTCKVFTSFLLLYRIELKKKFTNIYIVKKNVITPL